ncbi:hypothetical protein [Allokutzneria albata]|uniref:hypothetical protein n=1 Tax=Allokutzneria albata TaxID=211114 RepID=UPI0004C44275|nr:hypothetical protein [Allokutzneria albata]
MANRDFTALWVGQALSQLGTSVSTFAYLPPVLRLTDLAGALTLPHVFVCAVVESAFGVLLSPILL